MRRLLADPAEIDALLRRGAEKARAMSQPILRDVKQIVVDPEYHDDWVIEGSIDLDRSREAAAPVLMVTRIGT